jgi:hypothetical protein
VKPTGPPPGACLRAVLARLPDPRRRREQISGASTSDPGSLCPPVPGRSFGQRLPTSGR